MKTQLIPPFRGIAGLFMAALVPALLHADEVQPLEVTASAGKSHGGGIRNGKAVSYVKARASVYLRGGDAREAYAVGKVKAEPAMIDAKKCIPESDQDSREFRFVERSDSKSSDPEDGIRLSLSYGEIDPAAKAIDVVKGSVEVLTGGKEHEVIIDNLADRKAGVIESPVLEKAGIKIEFEREEMGAGFWAVSLIMSPKAKKSIAGIHIVHDDGEVTTNAVTNGWILGSYVGQCAVKDEDLKSSKLKLLVREGWEMKVLPFEVKNVPIK